MNDVVAFRTDGSAALRRPSQTQPDADGSEAAETAGEALALIRKTAETIRILQQEKEAAERQAYEFFEERKRERAERVSDLATFERKIEAALERVGVAEAQATEAKSQARAAMQLYEEAQSRELAASERAEVAETRAGQAEAALTQLEEALVEEFSSLVGRIDA